MSDLCCDLNLISDAICERLKNLEVFERKFNLYPDMPDKPSFPCIVVWPPSDLIDYHGTHGSQYLVQINLELRIGATGTGLNAFRVLKALLSVGFDQPSSIPDRFDQSLTAYDNTLGGLVGSVTVTNGRLLPTGDPNSNVFEAAIGLRITTNRKAS